MFFRIGFGAADLVDENVIEGEEAIAAVINVDKTFLPADARSVGGDFGSDDDAVGTDLCLATFAEVGNGFPDEARLAVYFYLAEDDFFAVAEADAGFDVGFAGLSNEALLDLDAIGLKERDFIEALPKDFFGAFVGTFGFGAGDAMFLSSFRHKKFL